MVGDVVRNRALLGCVLLQPVRRWRACCWSSQFAFSFTIPAPCRLTVWEDVMYSKKRDPFAPTLREQAEDLAYVVLVLGGLAAVLAAFVAGAALLTRMIWGELTPGFWAGVTASVAVIVVRAVRALRKAW